MPEVKSAENEVATNIKKVKFEIDQFQFMIEIDVEVDMNKFTEELATNINDFFGGAEGRLEEEDGNIINTTLKLYACEMFQLMAFNNFKNEGWLTEQFNWKLEGKGVEGYDSLEDAGIKVVRADSWFIENDIIDLKFS